MKKLTRRRVLTGGGAMLLSSGIAAPGIVRAAAEERGLRVRAQEEADNGWLLTEQDRAEYLATDTRARSDILNLMDSADFVGGDSWSFRAGSLQECVTACERSESCAAFTFGKSTHPARTKRRMCWIKSEVSGEPVAGVEGYVSGIRRPR